MDTTTENNKYKQGKIYKIVNSTNDKIYVGSTTSTLSARLAQHKLHYRCEKSNYCSSFEILGLDEPKIILIENVTCNSKDELLAVERKHIEQNKDVCVNINLPLRTHKESAKEWYIENKDKILEDRKQYRENNNEIIAEKKKQYYESNKDKVSEYHHEYREKNKDRITDSNKNYYAERSKIIIECECGSKVNKHSLPKHLKTKKHLNK